MTPIELLADLLRCDTRNPPGDESAAAEVLHTHLTDIGLATDVLQSPEGRPNVVARLEGPSDKPALVLLSHMDVVPVEEERWTHDPFGGDIDKGAIWGRGALDMKGIAVMHIEAVRALAGARVDTTREVIICSVADEETGGAQGAQWLLQEHADKVGFGSGRPAPEVLGEGGFGLSGIVDRPVMPIIVGEKAAVRVEAVAKGDPGHGSLPPARMATKNLATFLDGVAGFRTPRVHPVMREQFAALAQTETGAKGRVFQVLASGAGSAAARLLAKPLRSQGAIAALLSDTISPTRIQAGYAGNVIPAEATASLDCRILPDTDADEFLAWLAEIGADNDVNVSASMRTGGEVSDKGGLYDALSAASRALPGDPIVTSSLSPGITDVRFFRARGARGYGWVPLVLDPELLATIHGHDERVPVGAFEAAVASMTEVVRRVAGAP